MNEDKGHMELMTDLQNLVRKARKFEFNDLKKDKKATPKWDLVLQLDRIMTRAKHGDYDNIDLK